MAVLMIRPDRTVHSANPAAENMLHQSARRMVGQSIVDLVRFEDDRIVSGLMEPDANFAAHNTQLFTGDRIGRRVDASLAPIGQHDGWQLLVLNDSGAGADLLDADHATDGFTIRGPEILAHEIKNPLAAIKGAAQLVERQADEKGRRLTELIRTEVDRIALLIDQMQSLTRQTSQPPAACNIHESITHACEILEAAHPGEISVVHEFDPSIPPILAVNESLVQIILNLLTNGMEACKDQPEPRLIVSTRFVSGVSLRLAHENRFVSLPVEVRISDNGPGIPDSLKEDVFSPFVTTKPSGQGLGLALVQKLVRDMNGRIVHDRDERRGLTNFKIFLPLAIERRNRS